MNLLHAADEKCIVYWSRTNTLCISRPQHATNSLNVACRGGKAEKCTYVARISPRAARSPQCGTSSHGGGLFGVAAMEWARMLCGPSLRHTEILSMTTAG